MLRLVYVANCSDGDPRHAGVYKKLVGQLMGLRAHSDATLLLAGDHAEGVSDGIVKVHAVRFDNPILKIIERPFRTRKLMEVLEDLSPQVIYLRYPGGDPFFYWLVRSAKSMGVRVYTEHQTKEVEELKALDKPIRRMSEVIWGPRILNLVDGVVCVTQEILDHQRSRVKRQLPGIVVGNGIDVSSIEVRNRVPRSSDEIRLVFVGNIANWHGLDRLIRGLALHKGEYRFSLSIIGDGDPVEVDRLKRMVSDLGLRNVDFLGAMKGERLDQALDLADVAVGCLGAHRKGLEEVAPLKHREYCAKGMPFIYTSFDPDFSGFPFALKLEAGEEPINMDVVANFYAMLSEQQDVSAKMRAYAEEFLDWGPKMKRVVDFIQSGAV